MNEIIKIDTITAEILILKQQTAQNIIEIGKRLIAIKESLPHGEFGKYLKEKVDFSHMTANRFMNAARECSNSTAMLNLEPTKIFALLDLPHEEREEFIKSNPVEEMTTRELQQAIKDREKALKEKQELENKLKAVSNNYEKLEKTSQKHVAQAEKLKKELESIENKNKEVLVNREVEIENLRNHMEELKRQISEAKASGNNEEIERLQASLQESEDELEIYKTKINELEQQLKEKPIDVITAEPQIIEKIPEEVEKELQELRERLSKGNGSNESLIKYKLHFNELVLKFKELLGDLAEIKEADETTYEKYRKAFFGLIEKMSGAV
jgi:chromosome segregation ATPase